MLTITTSTHNKSIKRFYKSHRYSASLMGYDHVYQVKKNETIIACAIVSYQNKDNHQSLLHALVVDSKYQKQGIASKLIHYICQQHKHIVCFCQSSLVQLYLKSQFTRCAMNALTLVNQKRLLRYQTTKDLVSCLYNNKKSI